MKKLERINSVKFPTLTKLQQSHVRGGGATGGGKRQIGAERFRDANGTAMINILYETWVSDEIGGGTECYYGLGKLWSGPMPY